MARRQLDRRLDPLRNVEGLARPPGGWVRAIRNALGMTTAQLARRIGVYQPRIVRLEQAEVEDSVTLATLRQAAAALDCTLHYVFVPKQQLTDLFRARALTAAKELLGRTHQSMNLEGQALERGELDAESERLVDEFIRGDPARLWDAP